MNLTQTQVLALRVNQVSDDAKRSGSCKLHLIPLFHTFPWASLATSLGKERLIVLGKAKLIVHVP